MQTTLSASADITPASSSRRSEPTTLPTPLLPATGGITYAYDQFGRRISKTIAGSPSLTIEYCYDGDQIIAEYEREGTGNPVLVRKYIYGPGIDEPVAMIDCTGQQEVWYYYHVCFASRFIGNGCGNVVALSNSNSPNPPQIVEAYSYDHFGAPVVMTGPGTDGVWATYGDNPAASLVGARHATPG